MTNSIKVFENEEFGQVRILVIDDELWNRRHFGNRQKRCLQQLMEELWNTQ